MKMLSRSLSLLFSMTLFAIFVQPGMGATFSTIVTFKGMDGSFPRGELVADKNGDIYGTVEFGTVTFNFQGAVFRVSKDTNQLTILSRFVIDNGANPICGLLINDQGNLIGTTAGGVNGTLGNVFELNPQTKQLDILKTFTGPDGSGPFGTLISDAAGNLYGTTLEGGSASRGTVFKIDATTDSLTTLAAFNGSNGAYPYAGLTADSLGNLYGTTYQGGGGFGFGTVFEIAAGTNQLTTIYTFDAVHGLAPKGELLIDPQGDLYGTTSGGGQFGAGTIFRIDALTHQLTTLYSFTGGADGSLPEGNLIMDREGNLFGTTTVGGNLSLNSGLGLGTVYRLSAGTNQLTTLHTFLGGSEGAKPFSGLLADQFGNLFGTTTEGGFGERFKPQGYGTIYKLTDAGFVVPELNSITLLAAPTLVMLGYLMRQSTVKRHGRDCSAEGAVRLSNELGMSLS